MMHWNILETTQALANIIAISNEKPVLIFKHSTRCSISETALGRLERNWNDANDEKITPYYLDLIAHREISNTIASTFEVEHQSPQVLIIKNGKSIFDTSHLAITIPNIMNEL
jgi:bacillithiol system protein YtxJ